VNDGSFILVVDDDEDVCDVLAIVLTLKGQDVSVAHDGVEALAAIRARGRPRLILLDLRMPRLSGRELIEVLHRDPQLASIPIVVLSGDLAALDNVVGLGAQAYLRKPIELEELYRVVGQAAEASPDVGASSS
jgi:CheY-like chemotaxis protein